MPDEAAGQPRVLVIDDSPAVVALIRAHLDAAGCRVTASDNGADGLAAALHAPPDLILRWQHPTRGLLLPARFIPFADHSAVADDLARWVINAAVRQASDWRQLGHCIGVAVNLSARNLDNPRLAELISESLERWRLPAQLLTLELTETAVMRDERRAAEILTRVRSTGVSIAMDDFGTGQSSLHHLDRLPFDELKIDGSLVAHLDEDERRQVIVSATTHMAHRLGLRVVAEGVETECELQALAEIGCEAAQGFYLSRPLPADALLSWQLGRSSNLAPSGASARPAWLPRAPETLPRGHTDRT